MAAPPNRGREVSTDLIVRDNFFYGIADYGVFLNLTTSPATAIGRLVLQSNIVELITTAPVGVSIAATTGTAILQLVIRKNEIRHVDGGVGSSTACGVSLKAITNAIVEENIISLGTSPDTPTSTNAIVRDSTVSIIKTFNNQSRAGVFLACWNTSLSRHDGDPITDMEAGVMAL